MDAFAALDDTVLDRILTLVCRADAAGAAGAANAADAGRPWRPPAPHLALVSRRFCAAYRGLADVWAHVRLDCALLAPRPAAAPSAVAWLRHRAGVVQHLVLHNAGAVGAARGASGVVEGDRMEEFAAGLFRALGGGAGRLRSVEVSAWRHRTSDGGGLPVVALLAQFLLPLARAGAPRLEALRVAGPAARPELPGPRVDGSDPAGVFRGPWMGVMPTAEEELAAKPANRAAFSHLLGRLRSLDLTLDGLASNPGPLTVPPLGAPGALAGLTSLSLAGRTGPALLVPPPLLASLTALQRLRLEHARLPPMTPPLEAALGRVTALSLCGVVAAAPRAGRSGAALGRSLWSALPGLAALEALRVEDQPEAATGLPGAALACARLTSLALVRSAAPRWAPAGGAPAVAAPLVELHLEEVVAAGPPPDALWAALGLRLRSLTWRDVRRARDGAGGLRPRPRLTPLAALARLPRLEALRLEYCGLGRRWGALDALHAALAAGPARLNALSLEGNGVGSDAVHAAFADVLNPVL